MSRFSCLLLVSQALVAFSAPTFQLAPRGLSVLPLSDGITPQVLTLRENVARRDNAARNVIPRNKNEGASKAGAEGEQAKAGAEGEQAKANKKNGKKAAKAAKKPAEAVAAPAANSTAVSCLGLLNHGRFCYSQSLLAIS